MRITRAGSEARAIGTDLGNECVEALLLLELLQGARQHTRQLRAIALDLVQVAQNLSEGKTVQGKQAG